MKRLIVLLLSLGIMLALFAGCDVGGEGTEPTPTPTGTVHKTAIAAGDTYRYYYWNTMDANNPFADAGAREAMYVARWIDFQEQYGITIEYVQSTGGHEWFALPRSSAASGEPIADIFNVGGPYVVLGTYFYGGVAGACLLPFDDYSEYATFDDAQYWDVQSQSACTFNDKLYCVVPNNMGADMVTNNTVTLVNKDLLAGTGYTAQQLYELSESGQWTWDKYEDVAVQCTDPSKGIYGTAIGDNVALASALIVTNGGSYFEQSGNTEVFAGNSANALEAWDFFLRLADKGTMEYSGATEASLFTTGQVAMLVTTISRISSIYSSVQCDYGILMPPKGPKADNYMSEMSWFVPYSILRGANNPAGCAQVISEYFSPVYAKDSEENQQLMEAELSVYLRDDESMQTARNISQYTSVQNYYLYQTVSDGEQMLSLLYGNAWSFISGETTPEAFFSSVEQRINAMVKSARG